jgi:toxin ParE1/3/4
MPLLYFSHLALDDINAIWIWSNRAFGIVAAKRYELLIEQAASDVAKSPQRAGSQSVDIIGESIRVYHLRHSRRRVSNKASRVKKPRHAIYYRVHENSMVEIVRILHDRMDPFLHLDD